MTLEHLGAPMSLTLPFAPASVSVARRRLGHWLEGVDGCGTSSRDACALVVSELVGNAVRHGRPLRGGTVEVAWRQTDDGLEIAVTDGGSSGRPRKVDADLSALSGRGIAIVDALAGRWWVERGRGRTTVRALVVPEHARQLSLV